MKRLLLAGFLACSFALTANADSLPRRGSRCHDEACVLEQHNAWQIAVAHANAKYASRLSKMLGKWEAEGFDDDWFIKKYNKIHKACVADYRRAGTIWLYEVEGRSKEESNDLEDILEYRAEYYINQTLVSLWLEYRRL